MLRPDPRLLAPAIVAVLAIGGCGSHDVAEAQPAKAAAPVPASAQPGTIADASTWASHVLMSTDLARQAIARNDRTAAGKAIDEAIDFTNRLGSRKLVPIYAELSRVSVLGPVEAAKATTMAQTGSSSPASQGGAPPPAVKAVAGAYSRIIFDADTARARLQAAKAELAAGDTARADADLRTVQQSVVLETVSTNLPLVRARENVTLARAALQAGRPQDAKKELMAAQKALRDYAAALPNAPNAAAARGLADEIGTIYAVNASPNALTPEKLDGWWSHLATMTS